MHANGSTHVVAVNEIHDVSLPTRTTGVQYCPLTDHVLGNTRLALMVPQLHWLLAESELPGVQHDGHHWIWNKIDDWLDTFGWRNERAVRRVIEVGASSE